MTPNKEHGEATVYEQSLPLIRKICTCGPARFFPLFCGLYLPVLHAQNVDAKGGGQGRERTIGTRIRRRYDAQHEEDAGHGGQIGQGNGGVEKVRGCGSGQAHGSGVDLEQRAETEEEDVGEKEDDAEGQHVLLGVVVAGHAEVLLHEVLVQTRHDNGDEGPAEKLLEKVVGIGPAAVEEKPLPVVALADEPASCPQVRI